MPKLSRLVSLIVIAIVLLTTSGCASMRKRPEYKPSIPVLTLTPRSATCLTESGLVDCVVVATDDFRAVVRELKACCVALGNSEKECRSK